MTKRVGRRVEIYDDCSAFIIDYDPNGGMAETVQLEIENPDRLDISHIVACYLTGSMQVPKGQRKVTVKKPVEKDSEDFQKGRREND